MERAEQSLQNLISEYQALNSASIHEIHDRIPSALELSRSIFTNRPLVIRSYGQLQHAAGTKNDDHHHIESLGQWSDSHLIQRLANHPITVARTPFGNADSIVDGRYFVEPAYEKMTMSDFLAELRANDTAPENHYSGPSPSENSRADVLYLQSQDGNLSKELLPLLPDVGSHVPIASKALDTDKPDAANIWIGDDRSVTSLHKDPYENFYLVIEGSKTFTLFPPVEFYCMHESLYPAAQYMKDPLSKTWSVVPSVQSASSAKSGAGCGAMVPWISIDPLKPDYTKFPRFKYARPMTVTLLAGDLLYLPSLWYHHVQQHRTTPNGLIIACNWWYDMNYEGSAYALSAYLRREVLALEDDRPDNPRSQKI